MRQLIASGDLQTLIGAAADGRRLLEKAALTLDTARTVAERDPDSALVLASDAARHAATALLAHQGLRPTTKGGHYGLEQLGLFLTELRISRAGSCRRRLLHRPRGMRCGSCSACARNFTT